MVLAISVGETVGEKLEANVKSRRGPARLGIFRGGRLGTLSCRPLICGCLIAGLARSVPAGSAENLKFPFTRQFDERAGEKFKRTCAKSIPPEGTALHTRAADRADHDRLQFPSFAILAADVLGGFGCVPGPHVRSVPI